MGIEGTLRSKLEERVNKGNLRTLSLPSGLIDFLSNDYLGLAHSQKLRKIIKNEYAKATFHLNGSTGSRLLSGNSDYVESLEALLAQIFQGEKALIFNSGYTANLALLSCVPQKGDTIIYDEFAHACMREGAKLSFADRFVFKHNNLSDLNNKLNKAHGEKFVVVESVYSMDGDQCPLNEIIAVCKKFKANIIIDEAHSTGIWGKDGNGLACLLGVENELFARVYTFGKAIGVHGACVVGPKVLIDYLVNFARSFIYTTALPLHSLVSIRCAFNYLKGNLHKQKILEEKINLFRSLFTNKCKSLPIKLIDSESAIQALIVPGNEKIKYLAGKINSRGFDVRPILAPTVKEGEERLRICLHTYNSEKEIEKLLSVIPGEAENIAH